jgi:CHAT domain-containing protein/tetratricopeptide (TPR) repeat protein
LPCIVDEYELICTGGEHACVLYFDMYHPDHPDQAAPEGLSVLPNEPATRIGILNRQVRSLWQQGRYPHALSFAEQAWKDACAELEAVHPEYLNSLDNVTNLYLAAGDFGRAEPLVRQLLEVTRATLGERHLQFAASLNKLAGLYYSVGDYSNAQSLFRQALEVFRLARGENDPDYVACLGNLAAVYKDVGDYAQAEPLLRQALGTTRATLGEAHPNYGSSLRNLAAFYYETGAFALCEPLIRQAVEVTRASLGEAHPDHAAALNDMAELYRATGDYARAEPLLRQGLDIKRDVLGEGHPSYATGLHNLAALYQDMRDYSRAEPLYRRSLEIRRATLGEGHPSYAFGLNNLAALYNSVGDFARAEPLHRQSLEVRRARLGEVHPFYATSLNNLAKHYEHAGDHARAEPLYRQALDVVRAALGEASPVYAICLANLASLYRHTGDQGRAEPLLRQALDILRAAVGETHPDYVTNLADLAKLCAETRRPEEAFSLLRQAADADDDLIARIFSFSTDSQRAAYLGAARVRLSQLLSLVVTALADSPECVCCALDVVLRRKAVRAEADAVRRDAVLGGRYPHLQGQLRHLQILTAQIARGRLAGPGADGPEAHRCLLAQWEERREGLECELARKLPEMSLRQQLSAADRHAVALALPKGSALVEFVRYEAFDVPACPSLSPARQQRPAVQERYAAFVLAHGKPDDVRMTDLGEAGPIDRLVADFRAAVTSEGDDAPGDQLRVCILEPYEGAIGACRRLFLAPDGCLNWLPFEVLPTGGGRHLVNDYRISYVSVGRDVIRFQVATTRQATEPLVAADPDFDLGAPPSGEPAAALRPAIRFPRLPGTRAEGERVGQQLGVQPLLAGAALEGRLKASRSPRILHLATHGFFLVQQQTDLNQQDRNLELTSAGDAPGGGGRLSGPGMENPMLRSGLALAGANTFLRGGPLPKEAEDGLLTAEDVAVLDLLGTELVVLSACETGVGDVHFGEGVFGLRRAFVVAGARTLVMSLWKVPDLATAFLMERFYDNLLARGLDRDLALRDAQRATREVTVGELRVDWLSGTMIERLAAGDAGVRRAREELAQRPENHRPFEHPFYWGAFICQGDTTPLPESTRAGLGRVG